MEGVSWVQIVFTPFSRYQDFSGSHEDTDLPATLLLAGAGFAYNFIIQAIHELMDHEGWQ